MIPLWRVRHGGSGTGVWWPGYAAPASVPSRVALQWLDACDRRGRAAGSCMRPWFPWFRRECSSGGASRREHELAL